ncbi:MAG: hypothetical protein RLY86_3289 [Pseudomonadota bacterium]|jgi:prophage regulatory protein
MRFLRIKAVQDRTGLSKATIYRLTREGSFPRPARLGPKVSAWVESEIDAWAAARVRARDGGAA